MKYVIVILSVGSIFLISCGTVSHYGHRPDFSGINMGMSRQQVIGQLGKPDEMSAHGGLVYLRYSYAPWHDHNGADGNKEDYYVRLFDNRVDSFGRIGDFDSTKPPEQTINLNVKNR